MLKVNDHHIANVRNEDGNDAIAKIRKKNRMHFFYSVHYGSDFKVKVHILNKREHEHVKGIKKLICFLYEIFQ